MKISYSYLFYVIFFILFFDCGNKKNTGESGAITVQKENEGVNGDTSTIFKANKNFDYLVQQYEDPDRGEWQNPELVLEKLGNLEGKVVADIGAGTGYFTFPLATRAKKVIAIDIDSRFLDYIEEQKLDYPNQISEAIETRLSVEDDPLLKSNEANVVLMVNVYTFLDDRIDYLEKIKAGMQTPGSIFIIDFKTGEMPVGPIDAEKISYKTAMRELETAGYNVSEVDTVSLAYQYIIKAINP